MLQEKREKFKGISRIVGLFFLKLGLTPNQYTLISLIFALLSFAFLIRANFILALIFFLLAAFLDFIDGAVAKFAQKDYNPPKDGSSRYAGNSRVPTTLPRVSPSKRGAYLDTIIDRYVEGIVLLGFLFLPLSHFLLPAKVWIFLALFGGFLTTYAKAAAKEKNLVAGELKKGFISRGERIILLSLALILGIFNLSLVIYPLIILAVFSNLTALQRIWLALVSSSK